jgi:hypothetical protein
MESIDNANNNFERVSQYSMNDEKQASLIIHIRVIKIATATNPLSSSDIRGWTM